MKNKLSLLAVACLTCGCGGEGAGFAYFERIDEDEFALRSELHQDGKTDNIVTVGWLDPNWYFPLPNPEPYTYHFGIGASYPIEPITSGVFELGFIFGGMPFIPCFNGDRTDCVIVTSENYDDFRFCILTTLFYFPTGEAPPLSYEGPTSTETWLKYELKPLEVDLRGMLKGEDHRFGQVMVTKEDDYFEIGVFDSPEWTIEIPLDKLPPRCIVRTYSALRCYRISNGEKLYIYGEYGHIGQGEPVATGYYEDGILTLGVFEDVDQPNAGFTRLPYSDLSRRYVVDPDFFSDDNKIKLNQVDKKF